MTWPGIFLNLAILNNFIKNSIAIIAITSIKAVWGLIMMTYIYMIFFYFPKFMISSDPIRIAP